MRYEAAEVSCYATRVFTDAKPGGFVINHPHAEDRMVAVKLRQHRRRLINKAFFAVSAAIFFHEHAAFDPRNVAAFTAQLWLADVTIAERRGEFVSGQQIRMVRKKLPENRQQTFIAQKHFPCRLDELNTVFREMNAELFMPQPFPWIQLEAAFDEFVVEVNETILFLVPADVLDENRLRYQAGLLAGVAQVQHGHLVFGVFLEAAEVNCFPGPTPPRFDEPLVNRIELVGVGMRFLQPEPLRDGRLDKRGRSVGVVFEKFWRCGAVIAQIETSVETEVVAFPRTENCRNSGLGNAEPRPPIVFDDCFGGVNAEEMQFVRGSFDFVHFARGEVVTG